MLALCMLLFSGIMIVVDQITKQLAVQYLSGQSPVPIWPEVFELRFLEKGNDGVAYGMLSGEMWLIIPMTSFVMLMLVIMLFRSDFRHSKVFSLSCALILAGGIGNFIDRVTLGAVIDFLYFKLIDFPIFNFADCCVVVGAVLLLVFLLFLCKDTEFTGIRGLIFGSKPAEEDWLHDSTIKTMDYPDGSGK